MWFTFVTARLFLSLSFQPRLAATLLRSCSAVNSPTRRVGLAPTFKPASLAQPSLFSVEWPCSPRPATDTPVARPAPHGDFTVVPLITDQRYYGETPVGLRWGPASA